MFLSCMNSRLGLVSVDEVWSFKMCHLLDQFYRALCYITPINFFLPNLECILQEKSMHMALLRPHSKSSTQRLLAFIRQQMSWRRLSKLEEKKIKFSTEFSIEVAIWSGLQV